MKKHIIFLFFCLSSSAYPVTSDDIKAGYAEQDRACGNASGGRVSRACIDAVKRNQALSEQLNREIFQAMRQRDEDRQRIQQEEIWRDQVRRRWR